MRVTEECWTGVEGGPPGGEAFAGEGGGEAFAGAAAMIESDFLAMQPTVFPNKSCCILDARQMACRNIICDKK